MGAHAAPATPSTIITNTTNTNTTTHSGSTAHLVPESHPAHALLSVAHALLCPANALANPNMDKDLTDLSILPIDEVTMPSDEVSDLRDVVDAINKLCDTMKTSTYEDDEADFVECSANEFRDTQEIGATVTELVGEMISPDEVVVQKVETYSAERWSDTISQTSFPGQVEDVASDTEPVAVCSEMYYTASSEISLISDVELADRVVNEDEGQKNEKGGKECVMAGHVAAMRERFESMTRTNTPCPDLARSVSPSLDVFRNITPSPDLLG